MENKITKYDIPEGQILNKSKRGRWVFIKDHKAFVKDLKKENKKLKNAVDVWRRQYLNLQDNVHSIIKDRLNEREKEIRDHQAQIKKVLCEQMVEFVVVNHINEKMLINYNNTAEIQYLELKDVEELIRIVTGIKPDINSIMANEIKDADIWNPHGIIRKKECGPFEPEKPKQEVILIDVLTNFNHYDECKNAWYRCPNCLQINIIKLDKYCSDCGGKLEWTGIDDGINKPN